MENLHTEIDIVKGIGNLAVLGIAARRQQKKRL